MKRKIGVALLSVAMLAACSFGLVACGVENHQESGTQNGGGSNQEGDTLVPITGITFSNGSFVYDGNTHEITITGTLPDGVTVVYQNNSAVNAGAYEATAVLSGEGYETLMLEATLTIEKANLNVNDFSMNDVTEYYDGEIHSIEVVGTLPEGVTVVYEYDGTQAEGVIEPGAYAVKATLSGENYNPLTLEAELHLLPDLSHLAETVLSSFGTVPDMWQFLPESFRLDTSWTDAESAPDFTDFVDLSALPARPIGKQLDMIYGTVVEAQSLLQCVNTFYNATGAIATVYQTYINAHPEDHTQFDGSITVGDVEIVFRIMLLQDEYILLAKIGSASLEMAAFPAEERYTGRVEITENNALKFEVSPDSLIIGLNIAGIACTMLDFSRTEEGSVTGHLYESLDAAVAEFDTAAILTWNGDENGIVAVAGENGDFMVGAEGRVLEVYSAATGKYLAGKVYEVRSLPILGDVDFNTYWIPITSVQGIESVKSVEKSGLGGVVAGLTENPDEIYINDQSTVFATQTSALSRHFDIEMKTMYYYYYDSEAQQFEKVKCELPMMFVQEEYITDFSEEVAEANEGLMLKIILSSEEIGVLNAVYEELLPAYEAIKNLVTPEGVLSFIGTTNVYFETV